METSLNPPVADLEAFMKLYEESVSNKDPRVLLEIQRGRSRRSNVLTLTY